MSSNSPNFRVGSAHGAPGTNQLVNTMVDRTAAKMPNLAATSGPAPTGQLPPNGNPGIVPPPVPAPAATPDGVMHTMDIPQQTPPVAAPPTAAPVYADRAAWRAARPHYDPSMAPGAYHDSLRQWRDARPSHFNTPPGGGGIMAALNGPSPSITALAQQFPQLAAAIGSDPAQYKTNLIAAMQQHGVAPEVANTIAGRIQF